MSGKAMVSSCISKLHIVYRKQRVLYSRALRSERHVCTQLAVVENKSNQPERSPFKMRINGTNTP